MRLLVLSARFRKDVKQAEKRGKDMEKLRVALRLLAQGEALPPEYKDHPLKGDWRGFRDLHLEPDWILLYHPMEDRVHLARTGTHSDVFRE